MQQLLITNTFCMVLLIQLLRIQTTPFLHTEKGQKLQTSWVCSSVNAGCSSVTRVCLCNASYASE